MMTDTVSRTILAQLGGNMFAMMTGAKNFLGRPDGLSFKIGRNAKGVSHVRITLTAMDDYLVEFLAIRAGKVKPLAIEEGVYCDNLRQIFTARTGLDTSLTSR